MLGLDMLDVAIGVVFVFLLVSLIASAVAEYIESLLKKRSSDLERGIRELLKNDDVLVQALYDHPMINGLFEGTYAAARKDKKLPSYIPARSFALALMDLVLSSDQKSGASGATPQGAVPPPAPTDPNAPAAPPAADSTVQQNAAKIEAVSAQALAALRTVAAKDKPDARSLEERLQNLPADVAKSLVTFIDAAGGDAAKARANIEGWFDSSMDRVSGWYKRRNHHILVGIGLLLAIVFNIDTIAIVQSLWTNKGVREASVAAASAFAAKQPDTAIDPEAKIKQYSKALTSLQLPIGWASTDCGLDPNLPMRKRFRDPLWLDCWASSIPMHLIGWLITAAAVSLGAPFWFDTLNRIMVVRSTVKPREKSADEAPKERTAAGK